MNRPHPTAAEATGNGANRADAILAGAAQTLAAREYAAASMREVAQATGASLGSICHHFGSKEGLLQAIATTNFRRVRATLEEPLIEAGDRRATIEVFVENHVGFFTHDLDAMKVMSHELGTLHGPAREEVRALLDPQPRGPGPFSAGFARIWEGTNWRWPRCVSSACSTGPTAGSPRFPNTTSPQRLTQQMARLFLEGSPPALTGDCGGAGRRWPGTTGKRSWRRWYSRRRSWRGRDR